MPLYKKKYMLLFHTIVSISCGYLLVISGLGSGMNEIFVLP